MSTDQLREANIVLQRGDKNTARLILRDVLNKNPKSERGWLLLAKTTSQPSKIRFCLQQVLRINPENGEARSWLEELGTGPRIPTKPVEAGSPNAPPEPAPKLETHELSDAERIALDLDASENLGTGDLAGPEWEAIATTMTTRIGEIFTDFDENVDELDPSIAPPSTGWTWRCNPQGMYVAVSPSVYQILGYKPQEFYGQLMATFGLTFKSQIALEMVLQNARFPNELSVEFRTAHDEIVPVNLHILPYTNDHNVQEGLHGFTEVIHDLAEELPASTPTEAPVLLIQTTEPPPVVLKEPEELKHRFPLETKSLTTAAEAGGFGLFMRATQKEALTIQEIATEDTPTYCPFVGLSEDRHSRTAFPSPSNHCYAIEKPRRIKVSYQAGFCLAKGYIDCKIYQSYIQPTREQTQPAPHPKPRKRRSPIGVAFLVLAAILGILLIFLVLAYFLYLRFLV